MNAKESQQIIDGLLRAGQLTAKDVSDAKASSSSSAGMLDFLVKMGVLSEEDLAKAKAELLQIPYADVLGKQIRPQVFDAIPLDLAKTYGMVPFEQNENAISVGLTDPQNIRAVEVLDFMGRERGVDYKIFVISPASYRYVLQKYESLSSQVEQALGEAEGGSVAKELEVEQVEETGGDETIKTAPVSKVVHVIMKHAIEGLASDVHIEPMEAETRVRYRMDGELHTSILLPKNLHAAVVSRIKILTNLKIDETRRPQDGRFRITLGGREIDCRVSILPLYKQEKVVMRILDPSAMTIDLDRLGFEGAPKAALHRAIQKPHGIILATGPTGSGKSTTLYALLKILNREKDNIITLEDPVEYYLQGINQSQINVEVGLTFAAGLRSILRQDPDIIMVGEVRDSETAELVIHAGLTGHVVLSTLHTNDAIGAVPRLVDMGIEPYLISSALNIIVAQRLVRMICLHCVEKFSAPKEIEDEIRKELSDVVPEALPKGFNLGKPIQLSKGKGCPRCNNSGYRGRVAVAEVFEITDEIRQMIIDRAAPADQLKVARRQGMISMKEDGLLKVLAGQTTFEEIWHVTKE